MSNRLDQKREAELQPKRIEYAIFKIRDELGLPITHRDNTKIQFLLHGNIITLYPYSGWHTGKGIKDGRGIDNLLKQINSKL